ncbi:MAG: hypothetical protein WBX25_31505 [Rhodomicrobium sp.]
MISGADPELKPVVLALLDNQNNVETLCNWVERHAGVRLPERARP